MTLVMGIAPWPRFIRKNSTMILNRTICAGPAAGVRSHAACIAAPIYRMATPASDGEGGASAGVPEAAAATAAVPAAHARPAPAPPAAAVGTAGSRPSTVLTAKQKAKLDAIAASTEAADVRIAKMREMFVQQVRLCLWATQPRAMPVPTRGS